MTELDSAPGTSTGGSPNPQGSGGQAGQQNSQAELAALLAEMREIKRLVQSDKDRGLKKHEQRLSALERIFKEGGMAQEDAAEVARTLLPSADTTEKNVSTAPTGTGTTLDLSEAEKNVLEGFGLPQDDPDVVALKQRKGTLKDLAALAKQKATQPPASAAGAALPPGQTGGTLSDVELRQKYEAELKPLRGNTWAISELQRKYRKLGLTF